MMKYSFWIILLGISILLSFENLWKLTIPFSFVCLTLYVRWLHANIVGYINSTNARFSSNESSINESVKMLNNHTGLLKRLVPVEKLLPSIDKKLERNIKETQRNTKVLNKNLQEKKP